MSILGRVVDYGAVVECRPPAGYVRCCVADPLRRSAGVVWRLAGHVGRRRTHNYRRVAAQVGRWRMGLRSVAMIAEVQTVYLRL